MKEKEGHPAFGWAKPEDQIAAMLKKRWVYQQGCLTTTTVHVKGCGTLDCRIAGDSWDKAFGKSAADG